jgi:hypothetical protein
MMGDQTKMGWKGANCHKFWKDILGLAAIPQYTMAAAVSADIFVINRFSDSTRQGVYVYSKRE